MGASVLLSVGFITEISEAAYLPAFRLRDLWSEFLWFGSCGWLCHWPYSLRVFVICVQHVNYVVGCLVYMLRGEVSRGRWVLEEVSIGRLSLLGVGISQLVYVD